MTRDTADADRDRRSGIAGVRLTRADGWFRRVINSTQESTPNNVTPNRSADPSISEVSIAVAPTVSAAWARVERSPWAGSVVDAAQMVEATTRPRRSDARVSVVIPTLNEAANLPHVFARLPLERLFEVILVDGHSTDDTIKVARQLCPSVRVLVQDGKGKGDALACGFAAVRGDIIVMLDADGSTDPAEIPDYVDALFGGADFAKGSRFTEGGRSLDITPLRRRGNRFLNGTVNMLFGTDYSDLCYGYNAFWADLRPTLNVDCEGFEVETLINVRVAKAGLNVVEVPSVEHERVHGVSKLHPVRDGLRVLRTILRERLVAA